MQFRIRFLSAIWMVVGVVQSLAFTNASEPPGTSSRMPVRESLKFDPDDCLVLIPVRLGARDYQFAVDIGATGSIFDVSLQSHLGRALDTVRVAMPNADKEFHVYAPPHARVGSLPLTRTPVLCHDFTSLREAFGCPVQGMIGMDFLKDWIITIDFDEGRLDILAPGTERNSNWGTGIPIAYYPTGTICVLPAVARNVRTPFTVDTGHTGTGDLEEALLASLAASSEARVTGNTESIGPSGTFSSRVTRLSNFSLGGFQHQNLRFMSGRRNVLGLNYLSRYRVTIDFPNERLYLAKGKRFADPDPGNVSGIRPMFRSRGIEVESVDEKSPAHAAGVRAKDIIVELNGRAISELKSSEVRRVFRTQGKAVQITVQRDGKRMKMSFTPKEYE